VILSAKRAIVFGIHSFLSGDVKVGIQYIAEGLSEYGWKVDYISIVSSPFDLYGHETRKRLRRVWLRRQDKHGIYIKPGLTEYAFRTLYPAHKHFLRNDWLIDNFCRLAPSWLQNRKYDICINDITANILFLPFVHANLWVLRLNDAPEGFAHRLHQKLIDHFTNRISDLVYHEIWAVSAPLAKYALKLNPANNVIIIPNGVEDRFMSIAEKVSRQQKTAAYIGSVSQWVDLELLERTAFLLPDWQFHVYGSCDSPWSGRAPNLRRFPSVAHESVPKILAGYQVGLIPYREISGRMEFVERPLKFYEYIAAGLGVASTDIGALRTGMGDLSVFGNTPHEFANAIKQAAIAGTARSHEFNRRFVKEHSWKNILQKILHAHFNSSR
jgi:glycosyltransferase involved in cell wall biosynthesis